MDENTKAKITIRIQDKIVDILVSESDAFRVLDTLLGRVKTFMPPRVVSPIPRSSQESNPEDIKLNVPERSLIEQYIKAKDNYSFSKDEIIKHFVGNELSKLNEKDAYNWKNALYAKINRIRKEIEETEKGKWFSVGRGDDKKFKFVKENEGEIKTVGGEQLTVVNY
ncbi:MAG: hypothetical protein OIN85_01890 [Candidatus Methanoperedens sp.]|nr:hypothetical protein [Candidatus Methanoperedens sp.]